MSPEPWGDTTRVRKEMELRAELLEATGPVAGIGRVFIGEHGLRAGWGILLFASIVAACILASHQFFPSLYDVPRVVAPTGELLRNGFGILAVLGATWVLSKVEHRTIRSYGLGGERSLRKFAAGSGWGLLLFSLLTGILAVSGHLGLMGPSLRGASIVSNALVWMLAFFLVAFLEENLFRGYILKALARGFGFWPAATMLSVAFGLAHLRSQDEVLLGIGTAIVGGLIFSLALKLSGSLWWGIGFHAAWDWSESFLYGTSDSGYIAKGSLLTGRPMGAPLLSGGSAGPEGSLFVFPVLIATFFVAWLTLKHPSPGRSTPAKRA